MQCLPYPLTLNPITAHYQQQHKIAQPQSYCTVKLCGHITLDLKTITAMLGLRSLRKKSPFLNIIWAS